MNALTFLRRLLVILLAIGILYLVIRMFGRIIIAGVLLLALGFIIYKLW